MSNKNKRRVGQGMRPRETQAQSGEYAKQNIQEASATAGHDKTVTESIVEPRQPESGGSTLEPKSVQNLESPEDVSVARKNLEDLMRDSTDARTGKPDVIGLTGGHTPESTVGEVFGGATKITAPASAGALRAATPEEMEAMKRNHPLLVASRVSIADIESAISAGERVELKPDGSIELGGSVGQRPDGTFGLVVSIPEGYIDPIKQQAESDGVTAEEWVTTRLSEYLEGWWSAPKGR